MKHFFFSSILLLMTTVTFSQSTNFSIFVINPTNCPYSLTGTWWDTAGAGSVNWNSVDSTSSPSQDVWSATALTNTSTDSMMICVVPAPPCSCPQVCITQAINPGSNTIALCYGVGINEIVKENKKSVLICLDGNIIVNDKKFKRYNYASLVVGEEYNLDLNEDSVAVVFTQI